MRSDALRAPQGGPAALTVRHSVTLVSGPYALTSFDYPGAAGTYVGGTISSGDLAGTYFDAQGNAHGFWYSAYKKSFTPINYPGAGAAGTFAQSIRYGLNGTVIVGAYVDTKDNLRGFAYVEGQFWPIDFPGAQVTVVTAATVEGVEGWYIDAAGNRQGFVDVDHGYQTFHYPGAADTEVLGSQETILKSGLRGVMLVGDFSVKNETGDQGFWSEASGYPNEATVNYPGAVVTDVHGEEEGPWDTDLVGFFQTQIGGAGHGFFYHKGKFTPLDFNDCGASASTVAAMLEESGIIVGYCESADASVAHGFIGRPSIYGSLDKDSLTFPAQTVGTAGEQQTATLSNSGAKPLTDISVSISGTNSTDFALLQDTCKGRTLSPLGACIMTVQFLPKASGLRTAEVTITDNAFNSPHIVALSGTGTTGGTPGIKLSPTSLAFATQLVNTTSLSKNVNVYNSGTIPVSISGISAWGDFRETNNCGSSLAAKASCLIHVTFTPQFSGTRTGGVAIYDDAVGSPQQVSLGGSGTLVNLTPNPLAFGSLAAGKISAPKTLTVSNVSLQSVAMTGASVSGDYVIASKTCASSLPGGKSCTYSIEFKPTAKGARSGTFSLSDNGGGSPQTATLTGTGI